MEKIKKQSDKPTLFRKYKERILKFYITNKKLMKKLKKIDKNS